MPRSAAGRALVQPPRQAHDSVLTSKITMPGPPAWLVPRDRIKRLIADGACGPLTVITGPPGAGKTVALASWAARLGPVAWVTLDQYDNRPEVFWSYVIQALRNAGVAIPAELPPVAAQPDVFLHEVSLAVAGQEPAVPLVLDDLHVLTEPSCLDGLAYVLRNSSSGLHLLVASRMDPLLPLHRYRLTGELTEIRAGDLAFTIAEVRQLLAQHHIRLPVESVKTLTEREQGWAAGLRLAAISMSGHPDPEQFVKELDAEDGAIAGYLMDEVLNTQPLHIRDLLLKTSILDRVSVELADHLVGGGKAGEAIPALVRANAFIEPAGNGWYRYHPLFADVLRLKLRHECPHEVVQLRRRAAGWLWRNGSLHEAVGQAVAVGDWRLAARMTVEALAVGSLLSPHGCGSLAAVLKGIPAAQEPAEVPSLIVAAATALRGGRDSACITLLRDAESLLEQLPGDQEVASRFAAALVRLELARRHGDLEAAAAVAAQAEPLLGRLPTESVARHPQVRAQVLAGRAAADMYAGRLEDAASSLEQAAAAASEPGEWGECMGRRALLDAVRGRLGRAGKLAAAAATPPENGRSGTWLPIGAAEVALAWVHLDRNELSEASGRLSRAEDALRSQPDRLIGAVALLVAARLAMARGRPGTAAEMAGRARSGWSAPVWLEQRLALLESQAYAVLDDPEAALEAARRAGPPSSPAGAVALARARLGGLEPGAAAQALAAAPALSAGETPEYLRLEARLLEAELSYGSGQPDRGRQSLEQALRIANGERLLLPLVLRRGWLEPVLRHDAALADAFRSLVQPQRAGGVAGAAGQAAPVIVEALSERELEVLRQVSRMLSTAEIADEMYLSVNTVKSHLKSIFRKLGVTHRGEAVRRAQRLALL